MWLVFADLMRHLFAFLMRLLFAFLFSVTDCHDNIMVLAGLLSIIVLCTLHFSLFHLSGGRNLVAFRLILNVAFHIGHFSLHILEDGCALFLGLIRALGLIRPLEATLRSSLDIDSKKKNCEKKHVPGFSRMP